MPTLEQNVEHLLVQALVQTLDVPGGSQQADSLHEGEVEDLLAGDLRA